MADVLVDNKRLAKNTLFLYVRMIIIMLANLYVVRTVLNIIGIVDYGIYNVISGVVSMFSFLNGTLSTSSQRYFSISLSEKDTQKLQNQFRLNITIFMLLVVIVIIIAETLGLWYVNKEMTIPEDRLYAANIVYQFTILSFALNLLSVPYNALIVAHEQMKTFAYIALGEAVFKIFGVIVLLFINVDKLICYSILMTIITASISFYYYYFCRIKYRECRFKPYWNSEEAKDLIGFSGWHFLGTISVVVRSHGINLLINAFFSPVINAARTIAVQVESLVNQLSSNFFVAAKPQIYKSYASNDNKEFVNLIFRTTKICVFLVSLFAIPIIINAEFVLRLWLKDIPEYTVIFVKLVLLNTIIDSTSNPIICAALATKRIKIFYLITGNLYILCLPLSYLALSLGYEPTSTMVISIVISVLAAISRSIIINRLIVFPLKNYLFLFSKLLVVSFANWIINMQISLLFTSDLLTLITTGIISILLHILLYYYFIMNSDEKDLIKMLIKKILKNEVRNTNIS